MENIGFPQIEATYNTLSGRNHKYFPLAKKKEKSDRMDNALSNLEQKT